MAHYKNITAQEMEEFLSSQGFQLMTLPNVVEIVYGKVCRRHDMMYSIRIYTGINPDGNSRDVGRDAIRVEINWKDPTGTVRRCGGSKRVHRVQGWRKNLQNRLDHWYQALGPQCHCGAPMVLRTQRKSKHKFWGCSTYPQCKETKSK